MEDIVQIVRQIGQQQAHNAYYRDCYSLFKLLQELTEHTFTELQRLYKSGTERSTNSVHQLLRKFQHTICNLVERACEAQAECEEFCSVNESHSARVVFEPIRRMSPPTQSSHEPDTAIKKFRLPQNVHHRGEQCLAPPSATVL
ncbi:unnamed protein product, partial [Penicillium salamii]